MLKKDETTPLKIDSDALKANLRETAIDKLVIDSSYELLLSVAADFAGVRKKLENILYEVAHPYRNWQLIVPELRSFVMKNFNLFYHHKNGPESFLLLSDIFFKALGESGKKRALLATVLEALFSYVDKLLFSLNKDCFSYYVPVMGRVFKRLLELDKSGYEIGICFVHNNYPLKKIIRQLLNLLGDNELPSQLEYVVIFIEKILKNNYEFWLSESDPKLWFTSHLADYPNWQDDILLNSISHDTIRAHLQKLTTISRESDHLLKLKLMLELPDNMDIVRAYRDIPDKLAAELQENNSSFSGNRKLLFLFRIMNIPGLSLIHEETLREINRSLVQLIREQPYENIENFFVTTFKLLKANVRKYPQTSLQCIQVIGTEVFKKSSGSLVEAFIWQAVKFGFQYANVMGIDEEWQPISNPAHLANVRVWLNLIMQEPKWCSTLFSALIINIKLTGTCVKDTDLFQRDITNLLNHPIGPIYNLAKQFAKLMPVFFNEIGAEGELRAVSTELDELHKRQDILIHFLRKQSHVESSNLIVDFIQAVFKFWLTLDKSVLRDFLPEEIYEQVDENGVFVVDLHLLATRAERELKLLMPRDVVSWDDEAISYWLAKQSDVDEGERHRFFLLIRMYKLLHHKYSVSLSELRGQLEVAASNGFPEMAELLDSLDDDNPALSLNILLDHLASLKDIILSEETFTIREEIHFKRHVAVDIPSVYGRYSERKFDALGLSFRLESLANIYLEQLSSTINLDFITQATFIQIVDCLKLYLKALRIDGIHSRKLDTYLSLLDSSKDIKRFSYSQHLDIIRGLSDGVKDIIYAYYTNIHQNNLSIIIPQIGKENLLTSYRPLWDDKDIPLTVLKLSEAFMRDLIATTFGLQHLDNFISKIITTLEAQKDLLDEKTLDLLLTYNPQKTISLLANENINTRNLIHLGNKGFNLMALAREGKPVPPAFIVTTEVFRCWKAISGFDKAKDEFLARIWRAVEGLEEQTGKLFGSPDNPLLLSIRSGSAISMPGMLSTIHNVGANQDMVEHFVKVHPDKVYFAWDNYRRFMQSWGMGQGMGREVFQALMTAHKKKYGKKLKREFAAQPEQMRELALLYADKVRAAGLFPPEEPELQLKYGLKMVLDSWDSLKAKEYRHLLDISDDWGSTVIIQAMVYGNLSQQAGSGVVFTAHPYRKVRRVALWGDYAPGDQGEDIVSGLVTSYPVSVEQAELDGRSVDNTLEVRFPDVYNRLLAIARDLVYTKEWNPQEIEFTFEGNRAEDLYILQTRDMITIKAKERLQVFVDPEQVKHSLLGRGIGVSGSAMSGLAVFNLDNIDKLRREQPGASLILIRRDTVPEDIKAIAATDGLLTSRGGQTSHASVIATKLEKTCVVGCRDLLVNESREYAKINGKEIGFASPVSIDGRNGLLIEGNFAIKEEVHILPL